MPEQREVPLRPSDGSAELDEKSAERNQQNVHSAFDYTNSDGDPATSQYQGIRSSDNDQRVLILDQKSTLTYENSNVYKDLASGGHGTNSQYSSQYIESNLVSSDNE